MKGVTKKYPLKLDFPPKAQASLSHDFLMSGHILVSIVNKEIIIFYKDLVLFYYFSNQESFIMAAKYKLLSWAGGDTQDQELEGP